jgi:methionyl-tRNA formyltransferase
MLMDVGLDTGDMILKDEVEITKIWQLVNYMIY